MKYYEPFVCLNYQGQTRHLFTALTVIVQMVLRDISSFEDREKEDTLSLQTGHNETTW